MFSIDLTSTKYYHYCHYSYYHFTACYYDIERDRLSSDKSNARSKGPERPQQQSSEMPGTSSIQHNREKYRNIINKNPEIHHVRLTCTNFVCTFESRYLPHLLHEPLQHQGLCLLMQTPPKKNELQQYHEIFLHSAIIYYNMFYSTPPSESLDYLRWPAGWHNAAAPRQEIDIILCYVQQLALGAIGRSWRSLLKLVREQIGCR